MLRVERLIKISQHRLHMASSQFLQHLSQVVAVQATCDIMGCMQLYTIQQLLENAKISERFTNTEHVVNLAKNKLHSRFAYSNLLAHSSHFRKVKAKERCYMRQYPNSCFSSSWAVAGPAHVTVAAHFRCPCWPPGSRCMLRKSCKSWRRDLRCQWRCRAGRLASPGCSR